jgi:hypothetical protein
MLQVLPSTAATPEHPTTKQALMLTPLSLTYQAGILLSAVVDQALAHLLVHMRAVVVGTHLRQTHASQQKS